MRIREAILDRAMSAIGGKEQARKDILLFERIIADIEQQIKREFDIKCLAELNTAPCLQGFDSEEQAIACIDEYEMPFYLQAEVEKYNKERQDYEERYNRQFVRRNIYVDMDICGRVSGSR